MYRLSVRTPRASTLSGSFEPKARDASFFFTPHVPHGPGRASSRSRDYYHRPNQLRSLFCPTRGMRMHPPTAHNITLHYARKKSARGAQFEMKKAKTGKRKRWNGRGLLPSLRLRIYAPRGKESRHLLASIHPLPPPYSSQFHMHSPHFFVPSMMADATPGE